MTKPARITWLVGPPGAGKTTFAGRHPDLRSVELTAMLGPLVDPPRRRKGVLRANGMLVAAIRAVELHPDNLDSPPLLVVAGLVSEDALFPRGEHEAVWLLLPERNRWVQQLRARTSGRESSRSYDDIDYSEQWYERFEAWLRRGLIDVRIDVEFEPELVGRIAGR